MIDTRLILVILVITFGLAFNFRIRRARFEQQFSPVKGVIGVFLSSAALVVPYSSTELSWIQTAALVIGCIAGVLIAILSYTKTLFRDKDRRLFFHQKNSIGTIFFLVLALKMVFLFGPLLYAAQDGFVQIADLEAMRFKISSLLLAGALMSYVGLISALMLAKYALCLQSATNMKPSPVSGRLRT